MRLCLRSCFITVKHIKNGIYFELFWSVTGQNGNGFPTYFYGLFSPNNGVNSWNYLSILFHDKDTENTHNM